MRIRSGSRTPSGRMPSCANLSVQAAQTSASQGQVIDGNKRAIAVADGFRTAPRLVVCCATGGIQPNPTDALVPVDPRLLPSTPEGWIGKIAGLLLTGFAISQGSQIWVHLDESPAQSALISLAARLGCKIQPKTKSKKCSIRQSPNISFRFPCFHSSMQGMVLFFLRKKGFQILRISGKLSVAASQVRFASVSPY